MDLTDLVRDLNNRINREAVEYGIRYEREINENGVCIYHYLVNGKEVAQMFSTYHPTLRFEIYWDGNKKSHRVHDIEEATGFILNLVRNGDFYNGYNSWK